MHMYLCINRLLTICCCLFALYNSVNSSSYSQLVSTLLLVTQGSNSTLDVPSNASRYLDSPVHAVYLTVVSIGAQCTLTNATVDASILERDVGEKHCPIPHG